MKIVLASSNPGKLAEFDALLQGSDIELVAQSTLGIDDVEETGLSFVENALLKARHAARCSGLPALADDSGLCVDALGGAPGIYSARYAGHHGDSTANIARLLDALRDVPNGGRGAKFVCVLALVRHADDPLPLLGEGRWSGSILHAPRGSGGFGYDPVFLDAARGVAAAELDAALKNHISHRARACVALRAQWPPRRAP